MDVPHPVVTQINKSHRHDQAATDQFKIDIEFKITHFFHHHIFCVIKGYYNKKKHKRYS